MNKFSIVVATDMNLGIGKNNSIPWKLSGDMRFFKQITSCKNIEDVEKIWMFKEHNSTEHVDIPKINDFEKNKNVVIMGRRTWDSLPENYRPLPDRENVVLSRSLFQPLFPGSPTFNSELIFPGEYSGTDHISSSLTSALASYSQNQKFIIGGGELYKEAIDHEVCESIYMTILEQNFDCDTHFSYDAFKKFNTTKITPYFTENQITYRIYKLERMK